MRDYKSNFTNQAPCFIEKPPGVIDPISKVPDIVSTVPDKVCLCPKFAELKSVVIWQESSELCPVLF